jgi:archaetidylserine synthase
MSSGTVAAGAVDSPPFMWPVGVPTGMSLQVRRRLGVADVLSLANATLGVVAMAAAVAVGPGIAARLVLIAAVADGLDGIVARRRGGTAVGPLLDSVADVVSFGTAPALLLFVATREAVAAATGSPVDSAAGLLAASVVPAALVTLSIVRTALYTVHVGPDENRPGIQNTLAASVLAAGYLAGVTGVVPLLAGGFVLSVLMIAPVAYPKLAARDALVMGLVQAGAILQPAAFARAFPRALLVAALAYMTLAPRYYWGD